MNYEGRVTSVNTTLWTFKLDNTVVVHMGCLAAYNIKQKLPEIGEFVELRNVHYKLNKLYQLQTLFLCQKSTVLCNQYKHNDREDLLLEIICNYNLGVSDLLEIDYNIKVVDDFIKSLAEESPEEIILKVLSCLAITDHQKANVHKCLNKNIPSFTLKTISNCQYIDLLSSYSEGPPWSFGVHTKYNKRDVLIGCLEVNNYGFICLRDSNYNMSCLITSKENNVKRCDILNKFVLIKNYQIFTETYREDGAINLEYILFDTADVLVLDMELDINNHSFAYKMPKDLAYVYDFEFKLLKKATINIVNESEAECWLEISYTKDFQHGNLGLNQSQIKIVPYLEEGGNYHVYHSKQMRTYKHLEVSRFTTHSMSKKFDENSAVFVPIRDCVNNNDEFIDPILNVVEALRKLKENSNRVSFQGLISAKKLTPPLPSRTRRKYNRIGFGTPGTKTHTLIFTDDAHECSLLLYLNNWENLQIPLGLVLDMRVCVRNILPQKGKYFKAYALTTFDILGYEPLVMFDTVNLKTDQTYGCDHYCFLGLGDLIPCNVLIWAKTVQLSVRSLKIVYKCVTCDYVIPKHCSCDVNQPALETTITLYAYDEMGQSVVISKSTELLRLLLGLESKQWEIWCQAFECVGEYIYASENSSEFLPSDVSAFCTALALSIKAINAMKISDLELKCRKMETSTADNEGMPKWFCIDARRKCCTYRI